MGKILIIALACLVSTKLPQTSAENRLSGFLFRSEVPEIVFFGATWCVWCPIQKAILRTLEEEVTYYDVDKDVAIYNLLRGTERRVPLTVILVDGKIKKRFVGVHSAIKIKRALEKEVIQRGYKDSKLSRLLRKSNVPKWLEKYSDLWSCNAIVYFGSKYCSACPAQEAILRGLVKEGHRVKYYDVLVDKALYDYLRKDERRVPLTIIFVDGEIKYTFVGVTSSLWIRPRAKECKGDCNQCK